MASLKELFALAESQVGYQEKASNACLDDFHENARHFHMDRDHYQAYNCACIYRAFQSVGRVSRSPQTGALIIFQDYRHVGRVTGIKEHRSS